jgi:peptide/nickel transport system permease protein
VKSTFVRFLLRRLIAGMLLVLTVSSASLIFGHFMPGDATTEMAAAGAGAEAIAQERARLGLDRPLAAQFGTWFLGLGRFDLGTSATYRRPVGELVGERAVNTALLATVALLIAAGIGLPLGLLTGSRPRGPLSLVVAPLSIALVSCPPIVGALALSLLAVRTGWLSMAPGALAVPALALGLPFAAMLERLQSRAIADALAAPNLVATAARGVPRARLIWIHAARQSLQPVLGIFGIMLGALFGGSLAVEYISGWPGLGRLMYDALAGRDLFLIAGCALFGAAFLAAGNLIADLLRAWIDPRVALQ